MHEYYGPRLNTASGSASTRPAQPIRTSAQRAIRAAIEETLAILSDPAAMREIEQGRAAIASGDIATKDEIEALRVQLRSKTA
jgi:predicted transcriptional regulator